MVTTLFMMHVASALLLRTDLTIGNRPPSLDDVIGGISNAEERFFGNANMRIQYARTNTKDVVSSSYSGGFLLAEWTIAYSSRKWFAERRFLAPVSTPTIWIPAEPTTELAKDHVLLEWSQYAKMATIQNFGSGGNIYGAFVYTRILGFDAPLHIARDNGVDISEVRKQYPDDADFPFVPECVRVNRVRYRVVPVAEEFEGRTCWKVEWPGMDEFWVCPTLGYQIVRRQFNWGIGKPPRYEHRNRDFREVKPGLWLPFKQEEDRFASILSEKESLWGSVAARNEYELRSVTIDDVPESQFEVSLPKGTYVIDMVRDFRYSVAGTDDLDPFSAEIDESKRDGAGIPVTSSNHSLFVILLNILSVVALLAWIYFRKRRSTNDR